MSEDDKAPFLFGEEHVRVYQETDGAEGHHWVRGTTVLLLTTTGRKSGQQRTTPLIYRQINGNYVIVASAGCADTPPAWYLNLRAESHVRIQVGAQVMDATARTASEAEKPQLWRAMAEVWPDYDDYQTKTDRPIPVVVLEPHDG